MNTQHVSTIGKFFASVGVLLAACCLLVACSGGNGLDGTYEGKNEAASVSLRFHSNGSVDITVDNAFSGASEKELKYERDGDKIKLIGPNGQNQVLTIQKDGSITGLGITLRSKK
jgi:hypothetical protein